MSNPRKRLSWTVNAGGQVTLDGIMDEFAELPSLAKELTAPSVTLDLAKVQRINSIGVRSWIQLLGALSSKKVLLVRCPPVIVEQLNCIASFRGGAEVKSVLLPYSCEPCASGFFRELELSGREVPAVPATAPCPSCGAASEFDDIPERYLNFVKFS